MNGWRFILRGLRFHWRVHLAVVLGVAAATAVLVGALLVGDSVRGSLRSLTLDRLGRIDELLVTDRFFREQLAERVSREPEFKADYELASPAILLPEASVEADGARANDVLVIGADKRFWAFDQGGARSRPIPGDDEVELNEPLARDLGVKVGDRVTVRVAKSDQVPADSPLAKKTDRVRNLAQLRVSAIVPARGLAALSLTPSQRTSRCAFLSLKKLQDALKQSDRVNAILVSGRERASPPDSAASRRLNDALAPTLADFGFRIDRVRTAFPEKERDGKVIFDYFHLTTDRLIFEPAAESAVREAFGDDAQAVMTYLANDIAKSESRGQDGASHGIPYSTVSAIDWEPFIGPLGKDEIVLNAWAADDQQAQPGDIIRITWFAPETTHGKAVEKSRVFRLKAIAPLTEPVKPFGRRGRRLIPPVFDLPPTLANDWNFTPEVEGVTDRDTIEEWDPPFPFDYDRMRPRDDAYWQQHRTTPKAFVSLAAGQEMWGSRFGDVTSFRLSAPEGLPPSGPEAESYLAELEKRWTKALVDQKSAFGFEFRPLKRDGLKASSGSTPFDVLFLCLSMFVIVAALLLTALLFRLGVEGRAVELGVLLAVGVPRRRAARLFVTEGIIVALVGGVFGVGLGVGYAALVIAALRDPNWWLGAVGTPFLELHVGALSLIGGYVAGVATSAAAIWFSIWQMRKAPARRLLAGAAGNAKGISKSGGWAALLTAAVLILAAIGLSLAATQLGGEAQAGAFVGSGALLLVGLLVYVWRMLRRDAGGKLASPSPLALMRLAFRSAARNPMRSTLTIGLMSAACFLIVSMSAFRQAPSSDGAGGFDLIAESSQPIYGDLNAAEGRQELLRASADVLQASTIVSLRVKSGDDASCNNLYQASQPQVWGVPESFLRIYDQKSRAFRCPWESLFAPPKDKDGPTPVIIDKNTAMYSLHLYKGIGEEFEVAYDGGLPVRFRVVGLLSNSVLQGALIVGEPDFLRLFPDVSGYRMFLIRSPSGATNRSAWAQAAFQKKATEEQGRITGVLEDRLGEQGFDVRRSYDVLSDLLAVQNTYLSTFQSLGALGLLLGSFGLAAVELRGVLERRGELALLRATGFRRRRLAQLVMLENSVLLIAGLLVGVIAAAAATAPHALAAGGGLPGLDLVAMLALVLAVGLMAGLFAVRAAVRAPLLQALRGK